MGERERDHMCVLSIDSRLRPYDYDYDRDYDYDYDCDYDHGYDYDHDYNAPWREWNGMD